MLRLVLQGFIYIFFIIPGIVNAQIYENKTRSSSYKVLPYNQEKKQIDQAYKDLGTSKNQEAYAISHKILKKTRFEKIKMQAYINLGVYFNDKSVSDSALYYGKNALQLIDKRSGPVWLKGKSFAYNIIAISYGDRGLYEESKKWHLFGLEIAQNFEDKKPYYNKLYNLATMDVKLGNYDNAIKHLHKCLEYKKDAKFISTVYNSFALIYYERDDYISALSYLKKSLEFFENKEDSKVKTVVIQNIGAISHFIKEYDEAIKYYNKAYYIAKSKGYHRITIDVMINLGLVYQDKKMYDKAEEAYKETLPIAEKLGYLDKQVTLYNNLEESSKSQNKYKEAYLFFEKKVNIKDSIRELQKDKEINELEVKFNTLQKEKEIEFLTIENKNRNLELVNQKEAIRNLKLQQEIEEKENENKVLAFQNTAEKALNENTLLKKNEELRKAELRIQEAETNRQKGFKNIILYSFLILMIPVIGLLITYYQKHKTQSELNKKKDEINEQKISSLLKDQELMVIKASIKGQDQERKRIAQELHDSIGGNLAAIKLQLNNTENNDLTTINTQIDDTYEQVRSLSHNLIPKKFTENNFCDVLEEYFNNIGKASSLHTSFIVYPRAEIDYLKEDLKVETFKIIQELVTNVIKHSKASSIELQLNLVENDLSILFEDNGIGFKVEEKTDGIGYRNIKNRLQKISGTIHIDSRIKRGTIIDITAPI